MKTYISYTPHGINENLFYPIYELHPQYQDMVKFRGEILKGKDYDFVLLFNSRNIRRKSIPDTLLAFKTFLDMLEPDQAAKCCIVLHTQPVDDNGTDLFAVRDMLFGDSAEHHVIFFENIAPVGIMNLLYNACDGVILISSNEGWGLSVTEGIMCGKPVIINVTGGMQDQIRFEDDNGNWIDISGEFSTNHLGKFTKHGPWGYPVYPSNISMQGSPLTPYIADDRADFMDAAEQIFALYNTDPEDRKSAGLKGREWLLSDEAKMSVTKMSENIINSIDTLFDKWEPRTSYEVLKVKARKKKHVLNPISH